MSRPSLTRTTRLQRDERHDVAIFALLHPDDLHVRRAMRALPRKQRSVVGLLHGVGGQVHGRKAVAELLECIGRELDDLEHAGLAALGSELIAAQRRANAGTSTSALPSAA